MTTETPDAAEIAAIRKLIDERTSTKRPKWQEPLTWMTWAEPFDDRIFAATRRLLAAVQAQAARRCALESENAALKNDLEIALDMILQGDANHDDLMWADMTHTERFGVFNRPNEGK